MTDPAVFGTTWLVHVLSIFCGSLVGFFLALTGGGGSILAVPLLLYVVGMHDIHMAIGTSALAVSLNAYANLIPHARAGHVHWRVAFIFSVMGIVGALAGSALGLWMDGQQLVSLFAILVLLVAALMVRPCRKPTVNAGAPTPVWQGLRLSGAGLGAGGLAGFFGVGGGFLIVPGLMLSARIPIIDAIGTSLFGVGSFGLTTALNYARAGLIQWPVVIEFIAGGVIGGWAGTHLACRLAGHRGTLNKLFAALLFAVGGYMLIRA